MSTLESRCLDSFPAWLRSLGDDARALSQLAEGDAGEAVRRPVLVALTYLFKSLDLIPDGLEDLGFVDDAFVLRVAATRIPEGQRGADPSGTLGRLASEASLIQEFLGDAYTKLDAYVASLGDSEARGRSVSSLLQDSSQAKELGREARAFADGYQAPGFVRDERNLVKLRSFLLARLSG